MLRNIVEQEVNEADEPIDFSGDMIGNERTQEENQQRWTILLKGLCSIGPGKRFKPSETAAKMIKSIKTSRDAYVPYVPRPSKQRRTGMQTYINIHDYFKEHFQ